jgi:type IV secretory pathway VirB9-like protein
LTCTARSGAVLRLNIDPIARQYQKEGFPILPMNKLTDRIIVLMRSSTRSLRIDALLDRRSLVYTARSEDLTTRKTTRTDYQCIAGPPFVTSGGR